MDRVAGWWSAALRGAPMLLLAACARFGFAPEAGSDHGPPPVDLRADGPATRDAAPADRADARSTNPWLGAFVVSDPEPLVALNSPAWDMEPHLSPDGLTLYFASMRNYGAGNWDGFFATRAHRESPFGEPVLHAAINTPATETHFALAHDELTAFLSSDRSGGAGGSDIWVAVRAQRTTPFAPPDFIPLELLNTPRDEYDPEPSADGRQLYYVTDDPAGGPGGKDIMIATRPTATGPFDAHAPLAAVNSTVTDDNPTISADGLVIVFSSSRAGGAAARDLYYATRPAADAPFAEPRPVPGVNTDDDDAETHLSKDGCELFFASDRPGGQGGLDLYRVTIAPQP